MKNAKKLFILLVLFICAMLSGCATIKDELIIPPDPDNPFQGTWFAEIGAGGYMHVIEGINGTWYTRSLGNWKKYAVYTIKENNNGEYITSNYWRINVNGNTLTVENMTYERVVK